MQILRLFEDPFHLLPFHQHQTFHGIHVREKKLLQHLKISQGLEIHYDGDLPARSGMGSSSCFTVGLSKALYKIKNKDLSKSQLTKKTIEFEQKIMKEVVGSQDQTIASYGGFNKII